MGIGKIISKVVFYANKSKLKANCMTKEAASLESLKKAAKGTNINVHETSGEILRMQNAKGGKVLGYNSVPTQKAVDDSFTVNFDRLSEVNKNGGYYDRKNVADALAGFKHGEKVESVITTSVPTREAVEQLNKVELVEQLKRAEITGQLTPEMTAKRLDMLEAISSTPTPTKLCNLKFPDKSVKMLVKLKKQIENPYNFSKIIK